MLLGPVLLKLIAILCVIALGYVVGRARWLGDNDPARTLGNAAFYIFVPALLFRTTTRLDIDAMPWGTLIAFFVPVVVLMLGAYALLRWRLQPGDPVAGPSVRSISACFGNTVQMGIPMAAAMFGEAGLSIHVALVSLHALTLLTLLTALVEMDLARDRVRQGGGDTHLGRMLLTTARILPDDGTLGRVLHTLIGYTANPTQLQLLVYAATIVGMVVLMRIAAAKSRAPSPAPVAAG